MLQNQNKDGAENLVISNEVIATIVTNAAKDVDGVAGTVQKNVEISKLFKNEVATKSVKVEMSDNMVVIDIYLILKQGYKIVTVAENVQSAVKEAVQNMTGYAVSKVNVHIEDVAFEKKEEPEKASE
jgi:uncharacterized alkaline shock family protein YloU